MKTNWSKEKLEEIVKNCYSYADLIKELGFTTSGAGYRMVHKYIDFYNLDISHFTKQRWQQSPKRSEEDLKLCKLEDILKEGTNYKSDYLKKRLIAAGYKTAKCENPKCNVTTEWCGKSLVLELHHINGNHFDNRLENLQILCPNCHSQTDSYCKRMSTRKNPEIIHKTNKPKPISLEKRTISKTCLYCGKEFLPQRNTQKFCCTECAQKSRISEAIFISKEKILEVIDNYNTLEALAKYFCVSRPTIRKYLDKYGLLDDFKSKFDFRVKPVLQLDLKGHVIKEWPSISDAQQTLGLIDIGKCANYQRRSCGGYIWRFKKE